MCKWLSPYSKPSWLNDSYHAESQGYRPTGMLEMGTPLGSLCFSNALSNISGDVAPAYAAAQDVSPTSTHHGSFLLTKAKGVLF